MMILVFHQHYKNTHIAQPSFVFENLFLWNYNFKNVPLKAGIPFQKLQHKINFTK